VNRQEVGFDSQGQRCAGWFYPSRAGGQRPCVVLAHGLAAIKEMRLDAYAERFAEAGYHALVFDYRHFGDSEGEPRQLLDIRKQHQDWHAAIANARARPDVDSKKVVLWGTSLAGGHVVAVAAQDRQISAVISQVPHMLGLTSGMAGGLIAGTRLTMHGLTDLLGSLFGFSPHYVDAAGEPGQLALMTAPGAHEAYMQLVPRRKAFDQRVAARFVLAAMRYSPGRQLRRLSMPVLLQVATSDQTTPASGALKSSRGATMVTVKTHEADHFDPYVEPLFSTFIAEQLDFLNQRFR
jgi:uncharacterized protein